jgi:hypothetical protein
MERFHEYESSIDLMEEHPFGSGTPRTITVARDRLAANQPLSPMTSF